MHKRTPAESVICGVKMLQSIMVASVQGIVVEIFAM